MKLSNRIKTCFTLLAGLAVIALLVGCASAPNQNPSGLGTFAYNLRFPGQYYDAETGHDYNYFRDYDPTVGRYIESDPLGVIGLNNSAGQLDKLYKLATWAMSPIKLHCLYCPI
ncbi:MAG TPA: RHS repeat-associated core domain-containing protein [Gammaproteobacteria bacterium]|nr:RHS repeat-associated core domain-containing protein [Gammaproteobacteria bacterium]